MFTSTIDKGLRNKLLICTIALAAALMLGILGSVFRLPILATVVVFFIAMNISFLRGTEGLYLIIFAMLFSPEIASGISTGRLVGEGGGGIVMRLEDIIMLAVVLGWMLRSAYMGQHFGIVKTPVNAAIWIYMGASIIATLLGLLGGSVRFFLVGFLHNMRYFQYFLLFFMILAHVRRKEIVARMIWAMFIVFFLAMIYGYMQIGLGGRICAPFDAEPNTFGGYIVLIMCLAGGIALTDNRENIRLAMIFLLLLAVPPLFFTLSRSSYFALAVGLLAFLAVSRHRILIAAVVIGLIAAMMLGLPMLPETVRERVAGTFKPERTYRVQSDTHVQIAGVKFDSSSSARLSSYHRALKRWVKSPVFGYGVTGTHFIDGQYPRLLVETGVIGLSAFLFIFWRLLGHVRNIFLEASDPFLKGAAMGFFCGIIAMLAHAITANSFIILRIAEPFWLLAGLILLIPHLEQQKEPEAATEPENVPNHKLAIGNFTRRGEGGRQSAIS